MKIFLTTLVLSIMIVSCGQNSDSKTGNEKINLSQNEVPELQIGKFINDLDPSHATCFTLFDSPGVNRVLLNFDKSDNTGRIIINGGEIKLIESVYDKTSGEVTFKGTETSIKGTGYTPDNIEAPNCSYGIFKDLTITHQGQQTTLHDIHMQVCEGLTSTVSEEPDAGAELYSFTEIQKSSNACDADIVVNEKCNSGYIYLTVKGNAFFKWVCADENGKEYTGMNFGPYKRNGANISLNLKNETDGSAVINTPGGMGFTMIKQNCSDRKDILYMFGGDNGPKNIVMKATPEERNSFFKAMGGKAFFDKFEQ